MFNTSTVLDFKNHITALEREKNLLSTAVESYQRRLAEIEAITSNSSEIEALLKELEKKTARVVKHYDSRSGRNEGHDIRLLSDGTTACTCPAGVNGKDCWAVKDYLFRRNAYYPGGISTKDLSDFVSRRSF